MAAQGFLLIATFLLVLMVLARPLGSGLARLINDIPLPGTTGVERVLFRALGVSDREMNWKQYLCAILGLNMLGLAVLFFMLLGQHYLPLNPQQLPGLSWDLALNTAVSFVTNTNWQSYSGETTLSYFSQMAGLTVQNFLSAASGIAVIFALIRAFTRQSMSTLGNAWVDLLRITLWVLVPVALLIALFFIQQGALQNFQPYQAVNTVEGAQQLLPMGPVASQEAIKMLGTNGGGFFNANSSHPFENPTALTNFVQMLAIFLIPTALCFAFGEVTGDRRQGRMLLWAMSVIFVICVGVVMWAEVQGNPHLLALGADSSINMEGKESRFGVLVSSLFAVVTTAASCGAVIAMHDSFTALGGMVLMGAALAMMTDAGRSAMLNPGPHGFSEVLYAVSSAANNNGSAFAGLSANSPFWNCLLAFCMFVGRFGVIIPVMAIAGSLVSKKSQPASSGTLPTHGPLFVGLLIGTVLLVGALTFIPALALGPVAEYLS
ncbi:potassium-transporting ATPase subunit KdpA [Escherichia coli]